MGVREVRRVISVRKKARAASFSVWVVLLFR
jgi:hypothetical protein